MTSVTPHSTGANGRPIDDYSVTATTLSVRLLVILVAALLCAFGVLLVLA